VRLWHAIGSGDVLRRYIRLLRALARPTLYIEAKPWALRGLRAFGSTTRRGRQALNDVQDAVGRAPGCADLPIAVYRCSGVQVGAIFDVRALLIPRLLLSGWFGSPAMGFRAEILA